MTYNTSDRRFLIASGTLKYRHGFAELPSVRDDLERIVGLLTAPSYGGYQRKLTSISSEPKSRAFRAGVRSWLNSRQRKSDDIVVFYYTGHGYINSAGQYIIATSDTNQGNSETGVPARFFVEALESSCIRHVLVILDVCFAGAAITDETVRLVANLTRSRGADATPQIWILAASRNEVAEEGVFSRALQRALTNAEAEAGDKQEYLPLETIVHEINRLFGIIVPQRACLGTLCGISERTRFFRNPKYRKLLPDGIDLETQRAMLQGDLEAHWGPRSRGVEIDAQKGWFFSGRQRALTKIISWIGAERRGGQILYVIGRPGTGKSAILARLVTLSDPTFRRDSPFRASSDDSIPPLGLVDAALHCRGKTVSDILREICVLMNMTATNSFDLTALIRDQQLRPVIVIDALDEAVDPEITLWDLLQMMAAAGARLVIGVRSETVALTIEAEIIDLDSVEYIAVEDITNYVMSLLLQGTPIENPYHEISAAKKVAEVIAECSFPNFLIARMIARSVIDANREITANQIPRSSGGAFDEYLARFGHEEQMVRDLLLALSYGEGQGLPRGDIWMAVARAVSGRSYGTRAINRVLTLAASYIVEEIEQGLSVYRLYHRALADHLRVGADDLSAHKAIARELRLLVAEIPETPGLRWLSAPAYIKRHLATHAAAGRDIIELLTDPGFLLSADPERLLQALPRELSGEAQSAAEAYQKAVHSLRDQSPGEAASYLEYSAQLDGAIELVGKISKLEWPRRWRTEWAMWEHRSPHRVIAVSPLSVTNAVMTRNAKQSVTVACEYSFRLLVCDPWTGQILSGHGQELVDSFPTALNATPAGGLPAVVIGYQSGAIASWSPLTSRVTGLSENAHRGSVLDIGFAILRGRIIVASCALDGALQLYDLPSLRPIGAPLTEHRRWLAQITAEPRDLGSYPQRYFPIDIAGLVAGRYIQIRGDSNEITAYVTLEDNAKAGIIPFKRFTAWFCSCVAHGDALDGELVVGCFDGRIMLWDLNQRFLSETNMRMEDDLVTALVVRKDSGHANSFCWD
jgi:hypothetical protein